MRSHHDRQVGRHWRFNLERQRELLQLPTNLREVALCTRLSVWQQSLEVLRKHTNRHIPGGGSSSCAGASCGAVHSAALAPPGVSGRTTATKRSRALARGATSMPTLSLACVSTQRPSRKKVSRNNTQPRVRAFATETTVAGRSARRRRAQSAGREMVNSARKQQCSCCGWRWCCVRGVDDGTRGPRRRVCSRVGAGVARRCVARSRPCATTAFRCRSALFVASSNERTNSARGALALPC